MKLDMSIRRVVLALAFAVGFAFVTSSSADAQVWKLKKNKPGATTPKKAKPAAARPAIKKKTPARKPAQRPKTRVRDLTGDSAPEDDDESDRSDRSNRFTRSEDDDPVEVTVEELD
jgi:hypothetical protein